MKNYYQLLEVPPSASADDVKRAFRLQIARYHPDKVHHLGQEFQEMAATRAAELTEAYRILSHEGRRAEYDAAVRAEGPAAAAAPAAEHAQAPAPTAEPSPKSDAGAAGPPPEKEKRGRGFGNVRDSGDAFVRKAILDRFRIAVAQAAGASYDDSEARGFDLSYTPKAKLFGRGKGPRLLGRLVPRVDGASVADAWGQVGKLNLPAGEEICVILMGIQVAEPRELAAAIAEQRRRPARGPRVTVIPVNASIWDAHMPTDAPDVAKTLLTRLRAGA